MIFGKKKKEIPFLYELKESLVTDTEMEYLECIESILPEGYLVLPQANLAAFITRTDQARYRGELFRNIDFIVTDLDYEAELAVIIGREASHVREEDVKDYIFGYTIINDVSARTLQTRHKQWYFGKGLDGFLPMGPCIATVDELSYPPKVQVQSRVNGELRQDSNTELLIFDISHIVSELSQGMTLKPGTIIATGTPAGVGMGFDPPKFLVPGDVVECTIEGIGTIANKVTD